MSKQIECEPAELFLIKIKMPGKGLARFGKLVKESCCYKSNSISTFEFCRGCSACMARGDCAISDDLAVLKNELASADGIILASPNYGNSYNAIMKQFLERMGLFEFLTSATFGNKYLAGISTAAGGKAKKVAKTLTNLTKNGIFKRGYVSGVLGINLNGKEITQLPGALAKAYTLGQKIAQDVKTAKKYPLQNILGRLMINIFVKPTFKKFIKRDRETTMKAVYENLRLRAMI